MNLKKLIRRWFGYSRREKAGSLILVIIVSAILITRLISDSELLNIKQSYSSGSQSYIESDSLVTADSSTVDLSEYELFIFDPNKVSYEKLLQLGLSMKQAGTFINYRESGAVFREAEDIRKVYGISLQKQDSLIKYIEIVRQSPTSRNDTEFKKYDNKIENNATTRPSAPFTLIDINRADSTMLMSIPGIGKILAPRIVKYRRILGGYSSISQLSEVYGLDSLRLNGIREYIAIDTSEISPLSINSVTYSDLIRHPYISKRNTEDILRYRSFEGKIISFTELLRNSILSVEEVNRLRPYISFKDTVNMGR
jgi:competence protein ComEA